MNTPPYPTNLNNHPIPGPSTNKAVVKPEDGKTTHHDSTRSLPEASHTETTEKNAEYDINNTDAQSRADSESPGCDSDNSSGKIVSGRNPTGGFSQRFGFISGASNRH